MRRVVLRYGCWNRRHRLEREIFRWEGQSVARRSRRFWVVPTSPICRQPIGLCGSPASRLVFIETSSITKNWTNNRPRCFHSVLSHTERRGASHGIRQQMLIYRHPRGSSGCNRGERHRSRNQFSAGTFYLGAHRKFESRTKPKPEVICL